MNSSATADIHASDALKRLIDLKMVPDFEPFSDANAV
jgi:hypothetical protein